MNRSNRTWDRSIKICKDMIAHRRRHHPRSRRSPRQLRGKVVRIQPAAGRDGPRTTSDSGDMRADQCCSSFEFIRSSNTCCFEDSKNSCAAHSSSSYLSLSIACIIMGIFAKPHPFYPPDLRLDDFHAMTVPASTIFGVGTTPSHHAPSHHAPSHHAPSHHAPSHHPPGMIIIIIIIIRSLARPS